MIEYYCDTCRRSFFSKELASACERDHDLQREAEQREARHATYLKLKQEFEP